MGDNCSVSASNKIFMGSLSIGLISALEERKVLMIKQWREHQGLRYLPSFSVVNFDGSYYAKIKYKESDYQLRMNKDLSKEIEGTMAVILNQKFAKDVKESRSFFRVEISDSSDFLISTDPVNHAHRRNPNKKWS